MSPARHYDVIVIRTGQGGPPLATALAQAGRKTAISEREHVGGACINEGCTPTKTMVARENITQIFVYLRIAAVLFVLVSFVPAWIRKRNQR